MFWAAMPSHRGPQTRAAFSLIELVIVTVIIGIIGAIAIPRVGDFVGRAEESALVEDLARVPGISPQLAQKIYDVFHGEE